MTPSSERRSEIRLGGRRRLMWRLFFEPRDMWVGVFWKVKIIPTSYKRFDLFVCVVPCLPLKLSLVTYPSKRSWS